VGFLKRSPLFLLILATGCRVGPAYEPPCFSAPEEWKGTDEQIEAPVIENWWDVFDDTILDDLEKTALVNSPNLYIALQRVLEGRALIGFARSDLFPQVNLQPSYSDSAYLFKILGLSTLPLPIETRINPILRVHQMQYTLPFNLSYELDLWGKIRSEVDAATAGTQAEIENYHNTLLTLTTDIATDYFLLRSLDAEIDFLKKTVEVQKNSYQLTLSRHEKGLVNYLDVTESLATLAQTEANLDETIRQRGVQENAIAALLGLHATCFTIEHNPLVSLPPQVPAGLPCAVLLRRPDIAKLEREAAADHALINVVYATFFPSFTLTGTLGFLSPDFRDFLSWKSRLWAMGANVSQTIFDAGKRCSALELAYANFRAASANYQQGVITALQEVEDALNNLQWQNKQVANLEVAANASEKAVTLSEHRYKAGLVNYLEVDTNQRNALQAESAYINALGQYYLSTVSLIKAIGGGWDCPSYRECDPSETN